MEGSDRGGSNDGPGDPLGVLDEPSNDFPPRGDLAQVRGWCVFPGSHVARVEVILDGAYIGRAAIFVPRDDLSDVLAERDAPVSGFHLLLNPNRYGGRGTSTVRVEAHSLDGRVWVSDTNRFEWARDDAVLGADRSDALLSRFAEQARQLGGPGKRLAVFTHSLSIGGGQLWLQDLLTQLRDVPDLDVFVVAFSDGLLREVLEDAGIQVHVTATPLMSSVDAYMGRVVEIATLLRAWGTGVVLINTLGLTAVAHAARAAGIPVLWAIHESFETPIFRYLNWGTEGVDPFVRTLFDESLAIPDALIFEAPQTADLFATLTKPDRRFVIDYDVDIGLIDEYRAANDKSHVRQELGYSDDDYVVVVVGVYEERKAQALVVAAVDELRKVHPNIRLALVGAHKGTYLTCLEEQIDRYQVHDFIDVVETTPDVYRWYVAADLFVCASDVESLPRSILEAMAFELPVVSTDVFGIRDLIDNGRTGWLTDARDLEAMTGLIHYVMSLAPEDRAQVADRARLEVVERGGSSRYGQRIGRAALALMAGDREQMIRHLAGNEELETSTR